jgi:predicted GNAT family acetyltransferase
MTASVVRDHPTKNRFELEVEGHVAISEYVRTPGVVKFIHTDVPKELGGKGVGSQLAKGALDLVRASGDKVIAQCPFIAAYIDKHPEYKDLLA